MDEIKTVNDGTARRKSGKQYHAGKKNNAEKYESCCRRKSSVKNNSSPLDGLQVCGEC